MGYRVHVELKKENREFRMYPLCITTIEKELIFGGSLNQGDIVQIDESVQRYDSDTDDTLALEFVSSGQAIGVFELDKNLIISITNQREVMVGQVYKDKATLKEVMENYAICQRFQFRVDRSNAASYALLCMLEDCEWRFKASSINKSELFKVREFIDNHTCLLKDKVYEQRQESSSLIGGMIRPKLTNHKRKYNPKDIINDVKLDLGVDVSYMLAWRAKKRPIVVVDESHLKSYYIGTFFSASSLDGAGHILPLVYGVIDSENDAAWIWFFEQFKIAYGGRENMCIVSDRNESIIKSISRVYPDVPHFACIWDLWNNVYNKFKKSHAKLSEIYFSMAKAYTQAEFDSLMEKMEKVVPSIEYLHTVNDGGRHYTVCMLERKCVCGRFQVDELPCPHAWAVLKSKFLMPEDYFSNYYKPNSVVMTYDVSVIPLPDRNDWNIPAHVAEEVVLPPKWKRPPGMPNKKHDKPFSELLQPKNQHPCSVCGHGGHNKRTCRNAPRQI
ncbi:uncharacterized protein LOC107818341 [Nicotiana tabacum]|uniref:Uncharacterized protein LOC107818341 n=1 Tax=Nicotiana tabacum TaxID=4097 RepID=A0A1S4CF64_TOBAC|nr:PREDICTED: uncharacterized protein LOC107818341 [Nicotiana tabacum]